MTDLIKIDDDVVTTDDFIKYLKLNGRFDELLEDLVKDKLAIHAAKKRGVTVNGDDIQQRADQFRRVLGLHRAKEMNDFLDARGITLEELERHITDMLYHEKIIAEVVGDKAIEEHFKLNSPKFESVDLSHIILDSDGKAKEMMATLTDSPEMFQEMAKGYSIADAERGGKIGKVTRGSMQPAVEAKVFNASIGDILGPFSIGDGSHFEIIAIDGKKASRLDEETTSEIRKQLKDEWLASLAREHRIEPL